MLLLPLVINLSKLIYSPDKYYLSKCQYVLILSIIRYFYLQSRDSFFGAQVLPPGVKWYHIVWRREACKKLSVEYATNLLEAVDAAESNMRTWYTQVTEHPAGTPAERSWWLK